MSKSKLLQARIDEACEIASASGATDGTHHKAWVIDQMVMALLGDDYGLWVEQYEMNGDYEWERGIAP